MPATMRGDAAHAVDGGLKDPVFDAQTIFSRLMAAFAGPGTLADLGGFTGAPAPLPPAAAAVLAALADGDTPILLEGAFRSAAIRDWLGFQTGAAVTEDAEAARFVVVEARGAPDLSRYAAGTDRYPDRSATVLLAVDAATGGAPLELSGPGIESRRTVAPAGLPAGFLKAWRANGALYPRGVDVLLVAGGEALALPRTTRIREL